MRHSPVAGRRKLLLATSRRSDGSMGSSGSAADAKNLGNRKRFFRKLDIPFSRLVRCTQVHGNKILLVEKRFPRRGDRADGLFTRESNTFLGILTADCLPVFFWDRASSAVGIAHAGWRGVVKGIATKMVLQFRSSGISPRSLRVVIGHAIQKCHFEIWPRTWHKGLKPFIPTPSRIPCGLAAGIKGDFKSFPRSPVPRGKMWGFIRRHRSLFGKKKLLIEKDGRIFLDLPGVLYEELIRAGIPGSHIRSTGECTFHLSRRFFSHRRKTLGGRDQFGNMLSVIGIEIRSSI